MFFSFGWIINDPGSYYSGWVLTNLRTFVSGGMECRDSLLKKIRSHVKRSIFHEISFPKSNFLGIGLKKALIKIGFYTKSDRLCSRYSVI